MNLQPSQKKETEPAENTENTEKLGNTIMVSDFSIFTLTVKNLLFNCDHCNKTNSSEEGLTQHMWMKQNPSEDFRHYHFDTLVKRLGILTINRFTGYWLCLQSGFIFNVRHWSQRWVGDWAVISQLPVLRLPKREESETSGVLKHCLSKHSG